MNTESVDMNIEIKENVIKKKKTNSLQILGIILISLITTTLPLHLFVWFADGIGSANTGEPTMFYDRYFPFIFSILAVGIIIIVLEAKKENRNIENSAILTLFAYISVIVSIVVAFKIVFGIIILPINITLSIILIIILPIIIIESISFYLKK